MKIIYFILGIVFAFAIVDQFEKGEKEKNIVSFLIGIVYLLFSISCFYSVFHN